MLVLDAQNEYNFANITIDLEDNTIIADDTVTPEPEIPEFNMLIPTVQDVGITNQIELYYPNQPNRYILTHGNPNMMKFGVGPDLIYDILSKANSKIGIYTINLRGPSATAANVICKALYKVEPDVPYTDTEGNPYYLLEDGTLTTEPTGGTPVVRDVLKIRFVTESVSQIYKWPELYKYMEKMYTGKPDDSGYIAIPWFAIMYRGNTAFGNNSYFTLTPSRAEYDGNVYYTVNLFDGINKQRSNGTVSMDVNAGAEYNTSYYIENQFNEAFRNYKFMTAPGADMLTELISKYLYTLEDYIAGKMDTPSVSFASIDPFNLNSFAAQIDMDSIDITRANAFVFAEGTDGNESADELYSMFYRGEIITDLTSPLRYRFNYIPDIGYTDETKKEIATFMKKRIMMTRATFMVGDTDTMSSALIDHQANWYETDVNIHQICRAQSPMMYNNWCRRMLTYPAGYFQAIALVDHFIKWSSYYQPCAGADFRWTGFDPDTMPYANEDATTINAYYNARVNIVMRDASAGAYVSEQAMNTQFVSDQTELNNAFLVSNMLYDLVNLIHKNHYKFNEVAEVNQFNSAVDDNINRKYAQYAASLKVEVSRVGTTGRAKYANKIRVEVDLKDISKYAQVEMVLVDE